ncbi:MAG: hypothetical protein NTY17_01360 [Planctomycetia bacterium]|nr:hypothetical protein [Planctomycetia bacterium]
MLLAAVFGTGSGSAVAAQPKAQKSGHAHVHPTEGPHHGALIELGREDYHAELVHDDATNTVTIYILDGAAKDAVAIEAKQLTLNLLVGGKPQQFQLVSMPQSSDSEGRCSAFGCTSEPMCKAIDAKGTTGRLSVEVSGKRFVGKLGAHSHAH